MRYDCGFYDMQDAVSVIFMAANGLRSHRGRMRFCFDVIVLEELERQRQHRVALLNSRCMPMMMEIAV